MPGQKKGSLVGRIEQENVKRGVQRGGSEKSRLKKRGGYPGRKKNRGKTIEKKN